MIQDGKSLIKAANRSGPSMLPWGTPERTDTILDRVLLMYQALSIFVPKITIKAHNRPKWFTSTLQHQLNQLHTLRRKCTSTPSPSNQAKLLAAEQNFQSTISAAKHSYENSLINQFSEKQNSSIYKYLSFLTNSSSFPTTMHYNSSCASTDLDKAHL